MELDVNGLRVDSYEEIRNALVAEFTAPTAFGPNFSTDSASPGGMMVDIMARREWNLQNTMQDIFNAASPSKATGISLDYLADQKGLTRRRTTPASSTQFVWFENSVTLPSGWAVDSKATGFRFATESTYNLNADVIGVYLSFGTGTSDYSYIDSTMPTAINTVYIANAAGTGPDTEKMYQNFLTALTAQTVALGIEYKVSYIEDASGITMPPNFPAAPDDGTWKYPIIHIEYPGTTTFVAADQVGWAPLPIKIAKVAVYRPEVTPRPLLIDDIQTIVSPITGVFFTTNPQETYSGRQRESDSQLRSRILAYNMTGKATLAMIEFGIMNGVLEATYCKVSNGIVDGVNGIFISILGGTPQAIWPVIVEWKAAGVPCLPTGQNDETIWWEATGEQLYFNRPKPISLYVKITITTLAQGPTSGWWDRICNRIADRINNETSTGDLVGNSFLDLVYMENGLGQSTIQLRPENSTTWMDVYTVPANYIVQTNPSTNIIQG